MPGLVTLDDIQPGNRSSLFLHSKVHMEQFSDTLFPAALQNYFYSYNE